MYQQVYLEFFQNAKYFKEYISQKKNTFFGTILHSFVRPIQAIPHPHFLKKIYKIRIYILLIS